MATPAEVVLFPAAYQPRPDLVPVASAGLRLTFIVPVYNEAAPVAQVLERVEALPFEKQIVVVADGSTDGTSDVSEEGQNRSRGAVIRQLNRLMSAAMRVAIPHGPGEIVVILHVDGEH